MKLPSFTEFLHRQKKHRRCLGFLLLTQTNLISWIREILRGDMAGLASDFLLSESRSIPKIQRVICLSMDSKDLILYQYLKQNPKLCTCKHNWGIWSLHLEWWFSIKLRIGHCFAYTSVTSYLEFCKLMTWSISIKTKGKTLAVCILRNLGSKYTLW